MNHNKNIPPLGDRGLIKIGTRDSELALWQAKNVEKKLNDLEYKTEIVAVKSQGDIILDKPLYELGITGIFTKTLDIALLQHQIDIAVHSMKDVPTALPQNIVQAAVLERANTADILVHKGTLDFLNTEGTIATGSLRRQAQWLHRYPQHQVVDLRGNVNTRLQKLKENNWNGAVFAAAGLERLCLTPALSKGEGAKTSVIKSPTFEGVGEAFRQRVQRCLVEGNATEIVLTRCGKPALAVEHFHGPEQRAAGQVHLNAVRQKAHSVRGVVVHFDDRHRARLGIEKRRGAGIDACRSVHVVGDLYVHVRGQLVQVLVPHVVEGVGVALLHRRDPEGFVYLVDLFEQRVDVLDPDGHFFRRLVADDGKLCRVLVERLGDLLRAGADKA